MAIALAATVTTLGVVTAIGHSILSERKILWPLYTEPRGRVLASRATRAIIRAVFHMPSVAWATLGIAVLVAHFEGGNALIDAIAVVIFASAGLGNLIALRRPHPGGLMLLAAAALTIADMQMR